MADKLKIVTTTLPDGTLTPPAYEVWLKASGGGGDQTYRWSVIKGSLPPGLTMATLGGDIQGRPTQVGTSKFVVQVKSGEETAQQPLSIVVT